MKRSRLAVLFHLVTLVGVVPVLAASYRPSHTAAREAGNLAGVLLFHDTCRQASMRQRDALALAVPDSRGAFLYTRPAVNPPVAVPLLGNAVGGAAWPAGLPGRLAADRGVDFGAPMALRPLLSASRAGRDDVRVGHLPPLARGRSNSRIHLGIPIDVVWTWPVTDADAVPFTR